MRQVTKEVFDNNWYFFNFLVYLYRW
jgi:hypothetical protein